MAIGNYLTTQEAADALGISDGRVRQLYLQGRIVGEKIGSILLFDRVVVQKFSKQERLPGRPRQA